MKFNYIEIISSELPKLSEDQLFKVLVLVKETTLAARPEPTRAPRPIPLKNVPLVDDGRLIKTINLGDRAEAEAKIVQGIVKNLGLTGGYGIFTSTEKSSKDVTAASKFVYFCVPDRMDASIEIFTRIDGEFGYILTTREVGATDNEKNSTTLFTKEVLTAALNKIVKQYKQ